ncbi:MAG: ABC transporter substrate-binding protein [Pseudomonadota bacterium]
MTFQLATQWHVVNKILIRLPVTSIRCCLLVVCFLLSACSDRSISSPLTIGTFNWIGYQPFYIARELDLFQPSSIKLVELNNSTDIMYELRSRQLDGATLTLDEVITLLHDGMDLKIIFIIDISNGGDAILTKPGISSMAELTGKRIAVEYTAMGAMLLESALNYHSMSKKDLQIVPCTSDSHLNCYMDNEAIVTFEPIKTKLINQGANVVFDSSQTKGRIIDVLVIRSDILQEKHMAINELLTGYNQALEFMHLDPEKTNMIIKQRTNLGSDEINLMFKGIEIPGIKGNRELFAADDLQTNTLELIDIMIRNELITDPVSIENLFTDRFLFDQ